MADAPKKLARERKTYIDKLTSLLQKLEIGDIKTLVKKAEKMNERIYVSTAVQKALLKVPMVSNQLKLDFMSKGCKWTFGTSNPHLLCPELSFEGTTGCPRVVVVEIDQCFHNEPYYSNPGHNITKEFYRNFVYLKKTKQHYKDDYALVDIIRAGFKGNSILKDDLKGMDLIQKLKKYVIRVLKENVHDRITRPSTIRFWNYPADSHHIQLWTKGGPSVDSARQKRTKPKTKPPTRPTTKFERLRALESQTPIPITVFTLDDEHLCNVNLV